MKRTKTINLQKMRKMQPISIAFASTLLFASCSSDKEAVIYQSKADCINKNSEHAQQCVEAYEKALSEAESSAPKYNSINSCESEFGYNRCVRSAHNNWFMPALGGFMLGRLLSNNRYDYARAVPVYRYNGKWVGSHGNSYGTSYRNTTIVPKSSFNSKPRVQRTISRGGFGSTVHAKSFWGGSPSRSYGG